MKHYKISRVSDDLIFGTYLSNLLEDICEQMIADGSVKALPWIEFAQISDECKLMSRGTTSPSNAAYNLQHANCSSLHIYNDYRRVYAIVEVI